MPDQTNQAAPQGSSNKWMYIIIGAVIVLAILGFMARNMGYMAMRANGVDVTPNMDGSSTYTATDGTGGTMTVGGNKMPDNWPADVPQNFAGAQIQYSGSSNPQTGGAGSAVVYTVSGSASAVIDYYKAQLGSQGWTIENTANMGAASVLAAKKGDRTLGVSVVDAGNGSLQVSVGLDM